MSLDKYPPLAALPLQDLRAGLKAAMKKPDTVLDLAHLAMRLKRPENELGPILSEAASAGYVEPWSPARTASRKVMGWRLANAGLQLVHQRLGPPITRERAAVVLANVLERLRAFNEEAPSGLVATEGRLFGSFLDRSRETVGDVDLDLTVSLRDWQGGFSAAGLRRAEQMQAKLDRDLTKGVDEVQITFGEVETLGCPFEVVYRFNRQTSTSEITYWS